MIAGIIPGIYLLGSWLVAIPVLLIEKLRGLHALKRSRQLLRNRWWPTVVAVFIATILVTVFQAIVSGLLAVTLSDFNDFVRETGRALTTMAVGVLTAPLIAAVITVVYFDLRVRKEGLNLELLAGAIDVASESDHDKRPHGDEPPAP